MKQLLKQEVDLDLFLDVIGIYEVKDNMYCNEDACYVVKIEGDNLIIEDYSDEGYYAPPKTKTVSVPKTLEEALNLPELIYNETYSDDEKEETLYTYQAHLARMGAFVKLNQFMYLPKFQR